MNTQYYTVIELHSKFEDIFFSVEHKMKIKTHIQDANKDDSNHIRKAEQRNIYKW